MKVNERKEFSVDVESKEEIFFGEITLQTNSEIEYNKLLDRVMNPDATRCHTDIKENAEAICAILEEDINGRADIAAIVHDFLYRVKK